MSRLKQRTAPAQRPKEAPVPVLSEPDPDDGERRTPSRHSGTVGHVQELFNRNDPEFSEALQSTLRRAFSPNDSHYHVIKRIDAPRAHRTVAPPDIGIDYTLHSPPGHWGASPYSVLRWKVTCPEAKARRGRFLCHAGEEILYTSSQGLAYAFFDPRRPDHDIELDVSAGQIHRIRPHVPHYNFKRAANWTAPQDGPEGWMILRPLSGTSYTDAYPVAPDGESEGDAAAHFLTRDELRDPSRCAMHMWGMAESIRRMRQRSGLTINQLSDVVQMNASFLGRLETGKANVSMANLARLAHVLGIDLTAIPGLIGASPIVPVDGPRAKPPFEHWLHPYAHTLRLNRRLQVVPSPEPLAGDRWTWIVVRGEVLFRMDVAPAGAGPRPMKEILAADDVVHVRHVRADDSITLTALEDSILLEVRHSSRCSCSEPLHAEVKRTERKERLEP